MPEDPEPGRRPGHRGRERADRDADGGAHEHAQGDVEAGQGALDEAPPPGLQVQLLLDVVAPRGDDRVLPRVEDLLQRPAQRAHPVHHAGEAHRGRQDERSAGRDQHRGSDHRGEDLEPGRLIRRAAPLHDHDGRVVFPGAAVAERGRGVEHVLEDRRRADASRRTAASTPACPKDVAVRAPPLQDPVRREHEDVAHLHVRDPALEARLRQRPDDGAADHELPDARGGGEDQGRRMAGVDVDEIPRLLELGVEDGDEAAGEVAAVDDPVELAEHVAHLEVLLEAHPQPGHHVADQQRGRQPVAAGVPDRQPEQVVAEGEEVVEVAADLLRGDRARRQLVTRERRRLVEEQALLDLGRLPEAAPHPLVGEPRSERGADGVEREVQLLADPSPAQREPQDVPRRPHPDRDRRRRPGKRGLARALAREGGVEDVHAVLQDQPQDGGPRIRASRACRGSRRRRRPSVRTRRAARRRASPP